MEINALMVKKTAIKAQTTILLPIFAPIGFLVKQFLFQFLFYHL